MGEGRKGGREPRIEVIVKMRNKKVRGRGGGGGGGVRVGMRGQGGCEPRSYCESAIKIVGVGRWGLVGMGGRGSGRGRSRLPGLK